MARNTTRQGAGFELEIMHYLSGCQIREEPCNRRNHAGWTGFGYDCMRSSGSKGKIDVYAIGPKPWRELWENPHTIPVPGGPLLHIQAKVTTAALRTPLSPAERAVMLELAERAGAVPLTSSKAKDAVTGRVRPHFRRLTGTGPRDWVAWEPGEDD